MTVETDWMRTGKVFQMMEAATGVSEQFLNGTSAQYRLYSAILLKLQRN